MSRFSTVLFCGALLGSLAACGSSSPTDAGTTDVPVATDANTTPTDGGTTPTDGGGAGACYTEDGTASLCPMRRHMNNAMTPSWRITALTIAEPAALASPLILNVINPPLRDGKFLWGLSFNFMANTFRTGPLAGKTVLVTHDGRPHLLATTPFRLTAT